MRMRYERLNRDNHIIISLETSYFFLSIFVSSNLIFRNAKKMIKCLLRRNTIFLFSFLLYTVLRIMEFWINYESLQFAYYMTLLLVQRESTTARQLATMHFIVWWSETSPSPINSNCCPSFFLTVKF